MQVNFWKSIIYQILILDNSGSIKNDCYIWIHIYKYIYIHTIIVNKIGLFLIRINTGYIPYFFSFMDLFSSVHPSYNTTNIRFSHSLMFYPVCYFFDKNRSMSRSRGMAKSLKRCEIITILYYIVKQALLRIAVSHESENTIR